MVTLIQWKEHNEQVFLEQYPLHRACRDGDLATVVNFVNHASSEDTKMQLLTHEDSMFGFTPIHWSAYYGKSDCLRHLVSLMLSFVDLSTSRFRQTPAHSAALGGHSYCLQWLLQEGADPNLQDYLGETPLHKAVRTGSIECIKLLVSHGAKLDIACAKGTTPANLAGNCGYREVYELMTHLEQHRMQQDCTPFHDSPPASAGLEVRSRICGVSNGYYGYQMISTSGTNDSDEAMEDGDSGVPGRAVCRKRSRDDVVFADIKRFRTEEPPSVATSENGPWRSTVVNTNLAATQQSNLIACGVSPTNPYFIHTMIESYQGL